MSSTGRRLKKRAKAEDQKPPAIICAWNLQHHLPLPTILFKVSLNTSLRKILLGLTSNKIETLLQIQAVRFVRTFHSTGRSSRRRILIVCSSTTEWVETNAWARLKIGNLCQSSLSVAYLVKQLARQPKARGSAANSTFDRLKLSQKNRFSGCNMQNCFTGATNLHLLKLRRCGYALLCDQSNTP
jgi:hypothetical protein